MLGEFKHYKTRLAHGGIPQEVNDSLTSSILGVDYTFLPNFKLFFVYIGPKPPTGIWR